MSHTKLDVNQIQKREHDAASDAKRVTIVSTDMAIELNHLDGDSVTAHPHKLVASVKDLDPSDSGVVIPALDCSSLKMVSLSVQGTVTVKLEASPEDSGEFFYEVSTNGPTPVCARRLRVSVVSSGSGDVYLVGQG